MFDSILEGETMTYELLEHTADAKFRAYGKTKEEAFSSAIEALTAIVVDPKHVKRTREWHVSVTGKTLRELLFELLDELMFLHDTEHFLTGGVQELTITHEKGFKLSATLKGDDSKSYGGNLKAVTYSEMIAEEQDGQWVLQAVIDI
jgi:SHS2 domain-containing protein